MRSFYIFKINPYLEVLLKQKPYEIYRTLEIIYYRNLNEIDLGYEFINQLIKPISVKEIDITIFKNYKNNYFYTKYRNVHRMHDVYRKENTILTINRTYLKIQTDSMWPRFLNDLKTNEHFFICDFKEKDYFWLDSLKTKSVFI